MKRFLALTAVTAVLSFTNVAAVPIGIGDLTGGESVEGFEGLATSAQLTTWFNGWRTPVDGYVFPSGVSFQSVNPPNEDSDVIIGDTTLGDIGFGTSDGGSTNFAMNGTAHIADDGPGEGMSFVFDSVVSLAGMYVAGSSSITIAVYDAADALIESFTSNAFASTSSWSSNFIGIAAAGIKRVEFNSDSDYWVGDDLTFSAATVAEPASLALMGLALAGVGYRRRTGGLSV